MKAHTTFICQRVKNIEYCEFKNDYCCEGDEVLKEELSCYV